MDPTTRAHAQGLVDFIAASPTPYHVVRNIKTKLLANGFTELKEKDSWRISGNSKHFVTRNGSSLIAFHTGDTHGEIPHAAIVGAHTDSPCLRIKPISKKTAEGFLQVGVEQYGGMIAHTWFDRDLAVAGRVYIKQQDRYVSRLVHLDKPLMRIPTLAIHLNREANQKLEFNKESEFVPIAGQVEFQKGEGAHSCSDDPDLKLTPQQFAAVQHVVERHHSSLLSLVAEDLGVEVSQIEDFELLLCDHQAPTLGGLHDEFVFAPRQDNLTSCYAATESIISAACPRHGVSMISLFDHEEIGSVSAQGADSSFLVDVLARLPTNNGTTRMCSQSLLLSADQAHGVHPNYERFYEKANRPHVNGGPVIKINANQRYATNSRGILHMKSVAEKARVPLQLFVVQNGSPCGSTIGPMLSAKLGMLTVDLGNPQLSMHSIRETGGSHDVIRLCRLFEAFFAHYSPETVSCD